LLVLAGAAVAAAVILIGARSSQDGKEFVEKPWFLVWLVLIAAQGSLWAVSAPVFAGSWLRLRERFGIGREIWIASVAFAAAVAALFASQRIVPKLDLHSPLPGHPYRIGVLTALGAGVGLIGVQAITLVHRAAADRSGPLKSGLARFLFLRDELQTVLFFLGTMIGAATLASGALRIALIEDHRTDAHAFPAAAVLAYGGYFTLLLVAVYAPAYSSLLALGRHLRDEICGALPEKPEDPSAWAEWQSQRSTVEGFLQLNVSAGDRLKTGLAIAAPFAGSAISLLLGTGT
jgi:hypothetical protein